MLLSAACELRQRSVSTLERAVCSIWLGGPSVFDCNICLFDIGFCFSFRGSLCCTRKPATWLLMLRDKCTCDSHMSSKHNILSSHERAEQGCKQHVRVTPCNQRGALQAFPESDCHPLLLEPLEPTPPVHNSHQEGQQQVQRYTYRTNTNLQAIQQCQTCLTPV